MMCSKCKTFITIIEKPKVAHGYVAIPIVNYLGANYKKVNRKKQKS